MAAFLILRLAVWAATSGVAVRIVMAESGSTFPWSRFFDDLLADETTTDEEKSAALSEATGTLVVVSTYPGPFSLRKLHMVFGRSAGAAIPDDDAICTFHFIKLAGGEPQDVWMDADFLGVETAWDVCWNYLRPRWNDSLRLKQYRWYRSGPDVEAEQGGQGRTGPPVRVVDRNIAGGSSGLIALPPQVAISVTERTSSPHSWGRFYMPAPMAADSAWSNLGPDGRLEPAFQGIVADAWETAYQSVRAGGTPVVVYSQAKSERPSKRGGTLPAIGARALTVDAVTVDDLYDVIRSRRWSGPLIRQTRSID